MDTQCRQWITAEKASDDYAAHGANPLTKYMDLVLQESSESVVAVATALSGADHHAAAADHNELAARHHGFAAQHRDGKQYALASHEAQIAQYRALHSVFHGTEAAKHHVEHYGRAG